MSGVRVFHNGLVYTADAAGSRAQAVAVGAGRILMVGTDRDVLTAHPDADVIDVGGRTVLPGFIDPHIHPLSTGQAMGKVDVRAPGVDSIGDLVAALSGVVAGTPKGAWIRASGLDYTGYERVPTRWDLDRVSRSHPIGVMHVSGHYMLVNSYALEQAGVDDDTPDPPGGRLVRDEQGRITGLCQDAAHALVQPVAADIGSHGTNIHIDAPMDELVAAVERAGAAFLAAGLTTVADAQVSKRELAAYRETRRRGSWSVRTACMPLSHQLAEYESLGLAGPFGDDMLWIGPLKMYIDGSMIGGTATFCDPYGEHGEHDGLLYHEPEVLRDLVVRAHRNGWQIGIHAQGDKAIGIVLDAFEAAMEADPRSDPRHRIEHCGYPTPAQLERMAGLGVIAVNQPSLLVNNGEGFMAGLGPERGHWLQPMRAEANAGVRFVLSSDSPVTSFNPLVTMAAAMLRTTLGGQIIGPDQVITIEEAVRAHTIEAAYSLHAEDRLGSVEVGKLADLTVVDGDLFATPASQIADLGIWMTVLGGEVVYEGQR